MVGIFVIGLLFLIVLRLFIRSATAIDSTNRLDSIRTATLLLLQTSINIASILGLMPMTGVPYHLLVMVAPVTLFFSFAFGICLKLEKREGSK